MCVCKFVDWCNSNQGFLSFVLSVMTIIISVIAILVSIKIAYLPYLRRIKIVPSVYMKSENVIMDIIICNYGNTKIGIEHITVSDNRNLVLGMYNGNILNIKPMKMKKCKIEITDGLKYIEDNIIDLNNKIVIKLYDINDKEYKFKKGFPVG